MIYAELVAMAVGGYIVFCAVIFLLPVYMVRARGKLRKWREQRSLPPGDYVPDEWVAEYRRQNRGRP
jgi:hypothetical protein